MRACITYDITTHESAAQGDVAEHGWYLPGGWEHALEDSSGRHEGRLREALAGDFDLPLGEAIREALDLGCREVDLHKADRGTRLSSVSVYSVDPPGDRDYFESGEERRYCLHVDGLSVGSARRIARLFGGRQ